MMTKVTMTKLTASARSRLDASEFAFPRTRACPINDERHTALAWKMIDGTKGVTDTERQEARRLTLARAAELGIDTSEWNRFKTITLECMSLDISADDAHPNKMPFTGVLTRVDEPSDGAPGGSGGRRVMLTAGAARRALGSLLGMAVDYTPSFDGHDVKQKIGIITSADVVGNGLPIAGFIYAADFPEAAGLIRELKNSLGFSFEAQQIFVEDMSAEILKITDLTFTGAAILLKDKAAYTTTSLAASAENEDLNMTAEELKALLTPMLAEAVKPFTDRMTKIEADTASVLSMAQAAAKIRNDVEPHAAALDTQATAMEAAGIDASALRKMAAQMRTEAASGRMPTALAASATTPSTAAGGDLTALVASAVTEATKVLKNQLEESNTKLTDALAAGRLGSPQPGRKTVASNMSALLGKTTLEIPQEDGKKLQVAEVDKALAAANLPLTQRIMLKNELGRIGAL
jgi:hypothetical protein